MMEDTPSEASTQYESASETEWEQRSDDLSGIVPVPSRSSRESSRPESPATHRQHASASQAGNRKSETGEPSDASIFSRMGGMLGLPGSQPSLVKTDEPARNVLSRIEGSWLSHLDIDGKR